MVKSFNFFLLVLENPYKYTTYIFLNTPEFATPSPSLFAFFFPSHFVLELYLHPSLFPTGYYCYLRAKSSFL